MSLFQREQRPGLPTTHYFVSISRGDSIRTAMLTPAALWTLVALAPVCLGFGAAGALDLALGARIGGAVALRPADAGLGAPANLDDRGGKADEAERRRAAEDDALEARIREVVARQTRLEMRDAVVASLAEAARGVAPAPAGTAADALRAIESLGPKSPGAPRRAGVPGLDPARAYAPSAPALAQPPAPARAVFGAPGAASRAPQNLALLAAGPDLDPSTRLAFVNRSLDRIESGQLTALAGLDGVAARAADRDAAILADAGLDARRLAAIGPGAAVGGPFAPIEAGPGAPAFDRAAARVARDVAFAEKLRDLMPYVPLGKPLAGAASVASAFGYRIDPFLGRPALHSGVDLVEAYGSEIHAAGAGRVVHAGPIGGYGLMVEIDHGDGLTTRYGHLSETLVGEGDELGQGRGGRPSRLDRPLDRTSPALRSEDRRGTC